MTDRQEMLESIKQHFDEGLPFTEEHRIAAETDPVIAALIAELDQLTEDFSEDEVYSQSPIPAGLHAGIMSALAAAKPRQKARRRAAGLTSRWVITLVPLAAILQIVVLLNMLGQKATEKPTPIPEQQAVVSVPLPHVTFKPMLEEQRELMRERGRNVASAAEAFLRIPGGLLPKVAVLPEPTERPS